MSFDHATFSEAFARPGIDPRQWVSMGTVDLDTPEARSVRFNDDDGEPLQTGPLVTVTLQPSGITVVCRVASFIAGVGEGSWMPFQEKDEVIVVLPSGSERAGPIIVGRMNQALDAWPAIVAGQDSTQNTFGFWRLRTPFIIETADSFLIRSANTGSQVGIDPTGQVILNNGDKNNIFIGSDAISISSGDESMFLQLNFTESRITMAVDDARIELSGSGESIVHVPDVLNIGTGGARGKGHAVTMEQLFAWSANLVCGLALGGAFDPAGPYGTVAWTAGGAIPTLNTLLAMVVPGLVLPAPVGTGGAVGGNMASVAAPYAAMNLALLNPLPTLDPTGLIPGIGRSTLLY